MTTWEDVRDDVSELDDELVADRPEYHRPSS